MRTLTPVLCLLAASAAAPSLAGGRPPEAPAMAPEPTFLHAFGESPSRAPGHFNYPSSVAVDPTTGDVFVMDLWFGRVQRFSASGEPEASWDAPGLGIAVDPRDGSVYVAGHKAPVVRKFTRDGEPLGEWGGPGALRRPKDVSVDPQTGRVYVIEEGARQVRVFSPGGEALSAFPVDLYQPFGVAVSPDGQSIYVNSAGSSTVHRYSPDGELLSAWGGFGSEPGQLRWPRALSVDAQGLVYVSDTDNERVQVLTPDGESVRTFRGPHDLEVGTFHPRSVEVNPATGEIYVAAAYAQRIDRFDAGGAWIQSWGEQERDGAVLNGTRAIAVEPGSGAIYVADLGNHLIKRFSAEGTFELQFPTGLPEGLALEDPMWQLKSYYTFPGAIDLAPDGSIWLLSQGNHYPDDPLPELLLRRFSPTGELLETVRGPEEMTPQMRGLTVHPETGAFFVTNARHGMVLQLETDGALARTFGEGLLESPGPLALDTARGELLVADVGNQQIRAFDLVSGALLRSMTAPGLALTDFSNLDVHDDGRLFVADTGNRRVLVFSPEGALVGGFESREGPGGPLRKPIDVKLDGDRLYVVGNNRVQSFQLD